MRAVFGFDQGFDIYDDRGGGIARILPRVKKWLDENKSEPFFPNTYPSLPKEVIPAGTYKNQTADIKTYTEAGPFACRAGLPDELVYKIVKTIHENQTWLTQNVHKAIGRWVF